MFIDLDYKFVYIFSEKWNGDTLEYRFLHSNENGKYEYKNLCFDSENYPLKYLWTKLFDEDYQPLLTEMYY